MKLSHVAGIVALGLLGSAPAAADVVRLQDLVIEEAWARATAPGAKNGAAYLTIRNGGEQADRIVSMRAPVAEHVMAHETKQDGNVLKMQEVGPLAIPPGGALEMKPGAHTLC